MSSICFSEEKSKLVDELHEKLASKSNEANRLKSEVDRLTCFFRS